jgi:hypothetical protein
MYVFKSLNEFLGLIKLKKGSYSCILFEILGMILLDLIISNTSGNFDYF